MTCYNTNGMSIGVVGSHGDQTEYVQNVVFENLTLYDSVNVARIMTHPGKGHVKNITFRNIQFENVNQPIYLSSCIGTPPPGRGFGRLGADSLPRFSEELRGLSLQNQRHLVGECSRYEQV